MKRKYSRSPAGKSYSTLEQFEPRLLFSTYVVNTVSDAINRRDGLLTLRQAVAAANSHSGTDTIAFDAAVFVPSSLHTITLMQGEIRFTDKTGRTTVDGPGSMVLAVNANRASRAIEISTGVTVSVTGVTITNGVVNSPGGVLASGGGVQNAGILTLMGVTVSDSTAAGGSSDPTTGIGSDAAGGGIYSTGTLTLSATSITGNVVQGGEMGGAANSGNYIGGGNAAGGGIYSTGMLTISGSTISRNSAEGLGPAGNSEGGGIFTSGIFSLDSTTLSGNVATNIGARYIGSEGSAFGGAVYANGRCTISGGTFSSNQATGDPAENQTNGEGAGWGGAIFSNNWLSITAVTFAGNKAKGGSGDITNNDPGGNGYGGAIASNGNLIIAASTIAANLAEGGGGQSNGQQSEANGYGGGVYSTGQLAIIASTISGNTAHAGDLQGQSYGAAGGNGEGGGIYISATATLSNCSVINNTSIGGAGDLVPSGSVGSNNPGGGGAGEGGGIFNAGTLTMTNSTLAGNGSFGGGGAASNSAPGNGGDGVGGAIDSSGSLTLKDTTVTGNRVVGGVGGVSYDPNNYPSGTPGTDVGAGVAIASGNAVFDNTIISANLDNELIDKDISGSANLSSSHDLIGVGGGLSNGVNGNIVGVTSPKLSALGEYGGPTQTMVPLFGSPAIAAGSKALIPAGITTDQRGYPRTTGSSLDIGATQFGNATITGSAFNDLYASGKFQPGDPGLSSWVVYLDLNHNGQFDSADISSLTDASGMYLFADVPAGIYAVNIVDQRTYRRTTPTTLPAKVTVANGTNVAGPVFGETQDAFLSGIVLDPSTKKPLSGFRVYLDLNNDGKWESTEASVVTSSNGSWSFNLGMPGTYRVRIVTKTGYKVISPAGGVFTFAVGKASARIGNVFSAVMVH